MASTRLHNVELRNAQVSAPARRASVPSLDLDRHVIDPETIATDVGERVEYGIVTARARDDGVRGERVSSRRQRPHVQIVDLGDAVDPFERGL
jgi:hypothetical protein